MIPAPPAGSHYDALRIASIRKKTVLFRISDPGHASALYFNTDRSGRWNSPNGKYGVCYVTESVEGAFAETFGRGTMSHYPPATPKIISEARLAARHIYSIEANDTLRVGELFGKGLTKLNLDNNINTTTNYAQVQLWSAWVYDHPKALHGIRYQSRHLSDIRCYALFGRAKPLLKPVDLGPVAGWTNPTTNRTIYDILDEQGWVIVKA
ncbi:MAG: RES family NAD+ phosphorylase [Gammaproteobacteria bacterium]|jgi:hypothetical protein